MPIGKAIAGATHTAQRITCQDEDGDAWSLVGATITGILKPRRGGTSRAITGTMTIVGTGSTGQFDWAYSAADVVEAENWVQFKATFAGGAYDLFKKTEFDVLEAI